MMLPVYGDTLTCPPQQCMQILRCFYFGVHICPQFHLLKFHVLYIEEGWGLILRKYGLNVGQSQYLSSNKLCHCKYSNKKSKSRPSTLTVVHRIWTVHMIGHCREGAQGPGEKNQNSNTFQKGDSNSTDIMIRKIEKLFLL